MQAGTSPLSAGTASVTRRKFDVVIVGAVLVAGVWFVWHKLKAR